MESEPRYAYRCLHENDEIDGVRHFIPCLIKENVGGYFPMRGRGELSSPWYWGTSHERCQELCDQQNKKMGLTDVDVMEIVSSSIRMQNQR